MADQPAEFNYHITSQLALRRHPIVRLRAEAIYRPCAGSEQLSLGAYMFLIDDVGGEVYAGVERGGAVVLGLKKTSVDDIQSVLLIINAAHDNDYDSLCDEDYVFDLDLGDAEVAESAVAPPMRMAIWPVLQRHAGDVR